MDWIARSRELSARFAERAPEHDRAGTFPFENFTDLVDAGFAALTVPRAHGGHELSLTDFLRCQEELAAGDGSTALAYNMHAIRFGSERESHTYPQHWFDELCRGAVEHGWLCNTAATEEGLGSPAGGGLPETHAVEADGGWLLNGRKTFTTMAPLLHYFIVMAAIPASQPGAKPDIANFMVYRDDPGFRVEETWDTLGMRSTGSHDIVFESIRLPAGRLMTRREWGTPDPRGAAGAAWFALGVAATSLGIARAARDYAVAFARQRTPNDTRTIKDFPGVRAKIARADLLLHRSRTLIHDAAHHWETRSVIGDGLSLADGLEPALRVAAAKIDTMNACIEAVDLAMRVVGGVSLQKKRPIERYYRDVRAPLHNPPLEDRALEQLARAALDEPPEPVRGVE